MKKIFFLPLSLIVISAISQEKVYTDDWQSLDQRPIPGWFTDARFGIFIHWGVYSVPSYAEVVPDGYAEWYWYSLLNTDRHSYKNTRAFHDRVYGKDFMYQDFEHRFTAELYNPDQWAELFKSSGAKYVVLTSKHHEGYCLWNSPVADSSWGRPWNAVTGTPKRDLVGDLTTAVKKAGLRMGFYYSLAEWFNPIWLTDKKTYVNSVMIPQLKALVTQYKPSVLFADGEWYLSDTAWNSTAFLAWLYNESAVKTDIVVNDRWGKNTRGKHPSTYYTSEYGSGLGSGTVWEESKGMGQSYGYNRMEGINDYKSGHDLIVGLSDIVSNGGNLLLDIGPSADGLIPVIMQQRLKEIGAWLHENGEAIYETKPWHISHSWSKGIKPTVKNGVYQSGYDITKLITVKVDTANIEAFYTTRSNYLYAIIPDYLLSLQIPNLNISQVEKVFSLGSKKQLAFTQKGNDLRIDLSNLKPTDIKLTPFVVKIELKSTKKNNRFKTIWQ